MNEGDFHSELFFFSKGFKPVNPNNILIYEHTCWITFFVLVKLWLVRNLYGHYEKIPESSVSTLRGTHKNSFKKKTQTN